MQLIRQSQLKAYLKTKNANWFKTTIAFATISAIVIITIPETEYPLNIIRTILSIIFVFFLPGYALIKMLIPEKVQLKENGENLDKIERAVLSFCLSITLTSMIGLLLNYAPWGIRLIPVTLVLFVLVITFLVVALIKEYSENSNRPNDPCIPPKNVAIQATNYRFFLKKTKTSEIIQTEILSDFSKNQYHPKR
jgi:uncharacterized membrane protein